MKALTQAPEISEAAKKLDLSCPRHRLDDPDFKHFWNIFIEDVQQRNNIKRGHLIQLEFYCGLLCQAKALETVLNEVGHTFESEGGRNGPQVKLRPESTQYLNVMKEARQHAVTLNITLAKDTTITKEDEEKDKPKDKQW